MNGRDTNAPHGGATPQERFRHMADCIEEIIHVVADSLAREDSDTYDFGAVARQVGQFHECHIDAALYLIYQSARTDGQTCATMRGFIPGLRRSIEEAEVM
jgi:hypothetical protein